MLTGNKMYRRIHCTFNPTTFGIYVAGAVGKDKITGVMPLQSIELLMHKGTTQQAVNRIYPMLNGCRMDVILCRTMQG